MQRTATHHLSGVMKLYEEGVNLIRQHIGYDLLSRVISSMIHSYIIESELYGIDNALYHAIGTAYYMGIAKGVRMQKRHPKQ